LSEERLSGASGRRADRVALGALAVEVDLSLVAHAQPLGDAHRAKKTATKKTAAKKSPAKKAAAPKVSPLRGMSIDAWIDAKAKGWQADVIRRVIEVVARAAPQSTRSIKWGQPVFEQSGPFLWVRPAKAHVSVGFWRGGELADPRGLLEIGNRMGHFKVRAAGELDERALAAFVKDAVRLNREKGAPTARG
jgi:hypothetical protein